MPYYTNLPGRAVSQSLDAGHQALESTMQTAGFPSSFTFGGVFSTMMQGGADYLQEVARTEVVFKGAKAAIDGMRQSLNELGYTRAQGLAFMRDLGQITGQTVSQLDKGTQSILQFQRATGVSMGTMLSIAPLQKFGVEGDAGGMANQIMGAIHGKNAGWLEPTMAAMSNIMYSDMSIGMLSKDTWRGEMGLLSAVDTVGDTRHNANQQGEGAARISGNFTSNMGWGNMISMAANPMRPGESWLSYQMRIAEHTPENISAQLKFAQGMGRDAGGMMLMNSHMAANARDADALLATNSSEALRDPKAYLKAQEILDRSSAATTKPEKVSAGIRDALTDRGAEYINIAADKMLQFGGMFQNSVGLLIGSGLVSMLITAGKVAAYRVALGETVAGVAVGSAAATALPFVAAGAGAVAVGGIAYSKIKGGDFDPIVKGIRTGDWSDVVHYGKTGEVLHDRSGLTVKSGLHLGGMGDSELKIIGSELVHKGIHANLNDVNRTHAEQINLWNNRRNNKNLVARPGTSRHERGDGLAVDIALDKESDRPALNAIMKKQGFEWFGDRDPVHYQRSQEAATAAMLTAANSMKSLADAVKTGSSTHGSNTNPGVRK